MGEEIRNAYTEYQALQKESAAVVKSFDEFAAVGAHDAKKHLALVDALDKYKATLKDVVMTPEGAGLSTIKNSVAETLDEMLQRSAKIRDAREATKDEASVDNLMKLQAKAHEVNKQIYDTLIVAAHDSGLYQLTQSKEGDIHINPKDIPVQGEALQK